jgi:hypothetical protein
MRVAVRGVRSAPRPLRVVALDWHDEDDEVAGTLTVHVEV